MVDLAAGFPGALEPAPSAASELPAPYVVLQVAESGRPGRAELLAKKRPHSRRRRLSAELQNVREAPGKLREAPGKLGEAPTLSNFLEKCCILEKSRKKLVQI